MVNKASRYSSELAVALMRLCSVAVGPITALAIASRFSLDEQGYYFSFVSILSARVAFDAGVAQVIINTTGQEGRSLTVGRLKGFSGGDQAISAVRDVFHFAVWWYAASAVALLVVIGAGGFVFFQGAPHGNVNWQWPWILFVLLGSVDFACQSAWTMLEGLNQIVHIYMMRTVKTVASVLALAAVIFAGGGLWSVVAYMAASVAVDLVLIAFWFLPFKALMKVAGGVLSWRHAIWPFQWRMAVSWMGGYLGIPLFVPILFRTTGAADAGKVGMTMAIVTVCTSIAQSVIDAKIPHFCGLTAAQNWGELDHQFLRRGIFSMLLFLAVLVGVVAAIAGLDSLGIHFSSRIARWPVFFLFAGGVAVNQIVNIEANYMRCHRREPMMWPSIIFGMLSVFITCYLASRLGSLGVGTGFLGLTLIFSLPLATTILIVLRRRWHIPSKHA